MEIEVDLHSPSSLQYVCVSETARRAAAWVQYCIVEGMWTLHLCAAATRPFVRLLYERVLRCCMPTNCTVGE